MLSYRHLFSLWAGSNVLFPPYSPFSGHSGPLYYQQPPRRKSYWNRCWNFFEICTYRLSLVGPDGKKVGSISWRTDQAQRGPCAMTESQMFSRSARPDIADEYFIIWPITIENFENFVSDLIWRYRRALAGNKKDSTIESFPLFFRVRTTKPQLIEKPRLFLLFPSFSLSFCSKAAWGQGRMAFPDRLTSTRPALHTSAFTVAFLGDYACGALRALWWLCTSEGVKSSWMSSIVVFYTDWQQTLKEWNIQ